MKKRTKYVLLALIAVVAIILVIALLRGCRQDAGMSEDPDSASEMPMDQSPLLSGNAPDGYEDAAGQPQPNIDPDSGAELEEDELPIDRT